MTETIETPDKPTAEKPATISIGDSLRQDLRQRVNWFCASEDSDKERDFFVTAVLTVLESHLPSEIAVQLNTNTDVAFAYNDALNDIKTIITKAKKESQ